MSGKQVAGMGERRGAALDRQRMRELHDEARHRTGEGFLSFCDGCGRSFRAPRPDVRLCGPGVCLRSRHKLQGEPFSPEHFERWAYRLTLDNGRRWRVEEFQLEYLEDVFAGAREAWLLIAEGNGKTTLLAGLGLYHCQFHPSGRVPVAAASRDQAFELYLQAQALVEQSKGLLSVFTCHEGNRQIRCASQGSRLQVFSSDDRTGDGVIFTLALVDELHRHRDLRLYRTWVGKTEKRGGQVAGISTAGEPGSEFELVRETLRQQASERAEPRPGFLRARSGRLVLHEYALPEESSPEDIEAVKLANPFSGVTVKSLREKRASPTMTLEHWRRMTCNVATRTGSAAVSEREWLEAAGAPPIPEGEPIYAGLDVAWKWDCTALVPLWVAEGGAERIVGDPEILTPPRSGDMLDPDLVEQALLELHARSPISTLVMDTSKAEQLAVWAGRELGCEVVDRSQSAGHAAQDYERLLEALRLGWLRHPGHAELTRHVLNAVVKPLPGDRFMFARPSESRSGPRQTRARRHIDGLTALAMVNSFVSAELSAAEEPEQEPLVAFA